MKYGKCSKISNTKNEELKKERTPELFFSPHHWSKGKYQILQREIASLCKIVFIFLLTIKILLFKFLEDLQSVLQHHVLILGSNILILITFIAGPLGRCWKYKPERQGQHLPRVPANVTS